MLPKIKVFSWRISHNILPTYDNTARICHKFSNVCPKCKNREETLIHAMKDYPMTHEILTLRGLNNKLLNESYKCYIDWLEDVLCKLDAKATADFFTLLCDKIIQPP
ncbi:hypothetical protein J1N35_018645 [Gossypium stocksii]|uniref:Reverse transcriptase zinc-binding domain-containing protein n=1 Tax=Gossypium stocksii TaxID=47602 RepID=A0A9D4A6V9_9ROSI|nr:hypothetical protein J1N35_018645 [Gossypium stocksii]